MAGLVSAKKLDFVFLMETMVGWVHAENLRVRIGYEGCFCVLNEELKAGLMFLLKTNNMTQLLSSSSNHIDLEVSFLGRQQCRLTCYYGFLERARRRESWDFLRELKDKSRIPWVVIGDFNDLLTQSNKRGRVLHPWSMLEGFGEAL